ncbi:SLAM family member 9-like [Mugil cephalus]|uniref:SLAM family member 9-like n=1 Tax=Mugil cephalus TaxID=48193 RepID=UPI001FB5F36B|nr:SLAM family member 9-like [Mugil cephalus]
MEPVFTISPEVMVILLFQTLITDQANTVVYRKVGDEVVLSPGSEASPVSRITWKHNSNLAVVWNEGGTIDFFSSFRGHCELNTTTGELIIPELTLNDSGSYTAVINNRVLNTTEIKVISGVSKPTVSENCDAEKTHCVLTCEGITTDSEPVTYTWWSGDVVKNKTNQLIITKDDTEPSFICELENPVSSERSREVLNPFTSSSSSPHPTSSTSIPENNSNGLYRFFLSLGLDPGLGLGLSVVLVLAAVGVVIAGVFIYKCRTV